MEFEIRNNSSDMETLLVENNIKLMIILLCKINLVVQGYVVTFTLINKTRVCCCRIIVRPLGEKWLLQVSLIKPEQFLIEYQNSWPSYVMICQAVMQNVLFVDVAKTIFLITHVFLSLYLRFRFQVAAVDSEFKHTCKSKCTGSLGHNILNFVVQFERF